MSSKLRPPSGLKRADGYPRTKAFYRPRGAENRNLNAPPQGFSFMPGASIKPAISGCPLNSSTQADSSSIIENRSKTASVSSFHGPISTEKAHSSPHESMSSQQSQSGTCSAED